MQIFHTPFQEACEQLLWSLTTNFATLKTWQSDKKPLTANFVTPPAVAHRLVNHKENCLPKNNCLGLLCTCTATQITAQTCNLIIGCLRVDRTFDDYFSFEGSLYLVFLCCSICIGSRLTFVLYLPRQFVHFSIPSLQPIGEECKLQIASQLHTHPQSTFILLN